MTSPPTSAEARIKELEAQLDAERTVVELLREDKAQLDGEIAALQDELRKYKPNDAVELLLRAHYVLIDEAVTLFDAVSADVPTVEDWEQIAAWAQHPTVIDAQLQAKGFPPTGPGKMRAALDGLYETIASAAELLRAAPLREDIDDLTGKGTRRELRRLIDAWLARPTVVQVLERVRG